jgi:hypothetical protein
MFHDSVSPCSIVGVDLADDLGDGLRSTAADHFAGVKVFGFQTPQNVVGDFLGFRPDHVGYLLVAVTKTKSRLGILLPDLIFTLHKYTISYLLVAHVIVLVAVRLPLDQANFDSLWDHNALQFTVAHTTTLTASEIDIIAFVAILMWDIAKNAPHHRC